MGQTTSVTTYIGCLSSTYVPPALSTLTGQTSASDCADGCASAAYYYSFYQASTETCQCGSSQAPYSDYTTATDETYDCASADWTQYLTMTTNSLQACDATATPSGDDYYTYSASSFEECFASTACASYADINTAVYQPSTGTCYCGETTSFTFGAEEDCSTSSFWYFNHTAESAGVGPSQYQRRMLKERLIRDQSTMALQVYCPAPATACNVYSAHEAYECIDTATELESCGGCTLGSFNDETAAKGVDCTTLPGVVNGAYTCSEGKCVAFSCEDEWTLTVNGTCVASV